MQRRSQRRRPRPGAMRCGKRRALRRRRSSLGKLLPRAAHDGCAPPLRSLPQHHMRHISPANANQTHPTCSPAPLAPPRSAAPALAEDYSPPTLCDAACAAELDSLPRVTTPSGLQYVDLVKGRGASPPKGFQVTGEEAKRRGGLTVCVVIARRRSVVHRGLLTLMCFSQLFKAGVTVPLFGVQGGSGGWGGAGCKPWCGAPPDSRRRTVTWRRQLAPALDEAARGKGSPQAGPQLGLPHTCSPRSPTKCDAFQLTPLQPPRCCSGLCGHDAQRPCLRLLSGEGLPLPDSRRRRPGGGRCRAASCQGICSREPRILAGSQHLPSTLPAAPHTYMHMARPQRSCRPAAASPARGAAPASAWRSCPSTSVLQGGGCNKTPSSSLLPLPKKRRLWLGWTRGCCPCPPVACAASTSPASSPSQRACPQVGRRLVGVGFVYVCVCVCVGAEGGLAARSAIAAKRGGSDELDGCGCVAARAWPDRCCAVAVGAAKPGGRPALLSVLWPCRLAPVFRPSNPKHPCLALHHTAQRRAAPGCPLPVPSCLTWRFATSRALPMRTRSRAVAAMAAARSEALAGRGHSSLSC
jgi:hypothetical protein